MEASEVTKMGWSETTQITAESEQIQITEVQEIMRIIPELDPIKTEDSEMTAFPLQDPEVLVVVLTLAVASEAGHLAAAVEWDPEVAEEDNSKLKIIIIYNAKKDFITDFCSYILLVS